MNGLGTLSAAHLTAARHANLEIMAAITDCLSSEYGNADQLSSEYEHLESHIPINKLKERLDRLSESNELSRSSIHDQALEQAVDVLGKYLGPGNEPLWLSFALTSNTETGSDDHFGLPNPIFAHSSERVTKKWKGAPSTTRSFLLHVLEKSQSTDHICFGICIHAEPANKEKVPSINSGDSFHTLHVHEKGHFIFDGDAEFIKPFKEWEDEIKRQIERLGINKTHRDYYFEKYEALVPKGIGIRLQISATSIFRSVDDKQQKAAAQIVVGLKNAEDPYAVYQILQIILGGLPMAWSAITKLNTERIGLSRYRDTLEILRQPLERLGTAVREAQRDAQTLNSVLNEPSQALFAAHPLLTEVFEQGRYLPLPPLTILAQHGGRYNEEVRARLALAVILDRICGSSISLPQGTVDLCDALKIAQLQIKSFIQRSGSISTETCAAICHLANVERVDPIDLPEALLTCHNDAKGLGLANTSVARFKGALFTPFKMDTKKWPVIALELLLREFNPIDALTGSGSGKTDLDVKPEFTPVTYAAVLDFLYKVCSQMNGRLREPVYPQCEVEIGSGLCLTVTFYTETKDKTRTAIKYSEPAFDWQNIAKITRQRIVVGNSNPTPNVGDLSKPYADLARKMLGIANINRGGTTMEGWDVGDEVISHTQPAISYPVIAMTRGDSEFVIRAGDKLTLHWTFNRSHGSKK